MRDKIDRTIMRSLDMVEKLEKLFGNNGAFEQAVAENGGDIGWFGDVRENLKTLYSNIEELHMGAVSHMDESESVAESKMADMMIAASEMSKEEFAKAYPAFAKDYEKLRKQQMADEANDKKKKSLIKESIKVGDTVKPTKGPHKGHPHEVIHDFGDGHYNVKPIGLSSKQIRYRLGAAKAHQSDLLKEEDVVKEAAGITVSDWQAIRNRKAKLVDAGIEPEEAQDQAAEEMGVDPEELADWLDANDGGDFEGAEETWDGKVVYPKIGDTVEVYHSDYTDGPEEEHKPNAIGKIVGKGDGGWVLRWRDHESGEIIEEEFSAFDEFKILNKDAEDPTRINESLEEAIMVSAEGDEAAQLLSILQLAGLQPPAPAPMPAPAMGPMEPDMGMERLRDIVDGPKALPMPEEEMEEGKFKDQVIELQDALHNFAEEIQKGMHTYDDVIDELNGMFDDVEASEDKALMNAFKTLRTLEPEDFGEGEGGGPNRASSVAQDAMDMIDGDDDSDYPHLEGYDNEPDEFEQDIDSVIASGDDLHREKRMYKAAQPGDNPMRAFEGKFKSILDELLAEDEKQ